MILGTHNSFTGEPLIRKQRWLKWIINPFSRCQNKTVLQQFDAGVRVFDIQISLINGEWIATHGIAKYSTPVIYILEKLNNYNTPIYIKIGLDNGKDVELFKVFIETLKSTFKNITIFQVYKEKPWEILYTLDNFSVTEHYWSLSWAKTMANKWWKFFYYIPIPKLWSSLYKDKWKNEVTTEYYITDFV